MPNKRKDIPLIPMRGDLELRIKWWKSIGFKLFAVSISLLLITAIVITYQSGGSYYRSLQRNEESLLVSQADQIGSNVSGILETWVSSIPVAMYNFSSMSDSDFDRFLDTFVAAQQDMVAFTLVRTHADAATTLINQAATKRETEPRFEGRQISNIDRLLRTSLTEWIGEIQKNELQNLYFKNMASVTNLPMIAAAIPYFRDSDQATYWAIGTFWMTRIVKQLPANVIEKTFILDQYGDFFASRYTLIDQEKLANHAKMLFRKARTSAENLGFQSYQTNQSPFYMGFRKLPAFRLMAIVEHDARAPVNAIRSVIYKSIIIIFIAFWVGLATSAMAARWISRRTTRLVKATHKIALGDFDQVQGDDHGDELGYLGSEIGAMADRIKNLLVSQVASARQEAELATAKVVQENLLPSSQAQIGKLEIAGASRSASECGGDWWNYFTTEDGKIYFLIADATGHGAPAALVTAMAYSACTLYFNLVRQRTLSPTTPADVLTCINRVLVSSSNKTTTMTMFCASLDLHSGSLTFANAGHNAPYYIPTNLSQNEKGGPLPPNAIPLLNPGNPLGIQPDSAYKNKNIVMQPGDKFVFFTDGLIEGQNKKGREWGKRQLLKAIQNSRTLSAKKTCDSLISEAYKFFDNHPQDDDVTVVVAELSTSWQPTKAAS